MQSVFPQLDKTKLKEYHRYWEDLAVTNNADYFRRWLFAFCSVHTTWEGNVRAFEAIKDLAWLGDDEELRGRLLVSGGGLYNNRTKFISKFSEDFWSSPASFHRYTLEPWPTFRDRIAGKILGLGLAKTSFALELSFPTVVEVACLDVHMLRLYGISQHKVNPAKYHACENDWISRSHAINTAPYVARMTWWDAQQGKEDSRYWSHCLEKP